jgi:WD40 repeat protein
VWTRQFGSAGDDTANGVAVDTNGNVYVAGSAGAALPGQAAVGASDVFVRKYDSDGNEVWTRQFGSSGFDSGTVAVDAAGNVIVSGIAEALFAGVDAGGVDAGAIGYAFIRKYDGNGSELWTHQFGSAGSQVGGSGNVVGSASADAAGNIYFAGTTGGTLAGQSSSGEDDAFVRKYDSAGNVVWTRQFGTSDDDRSSFAWADTNGNVYVAGNTQGALPTFTSAGQSDAFVRKYDSNGNEAWTRQFGTSQPDIATAVQGDASGVVYVIGSTDGTLPGQTSAGSADGFIREYDANGNVLRTRQFGTAGFDDVLALSVATDALYLGGRTDGSFMPNEGTFDGFLIKIAK